MTIKIGDHVVVQDEGLAKLNEIMYRNGFASSVPNNTGIVESIENGFAYIIFDDSGQCAPYYLEECTVIE